MLGFDVSLKKKGEEAPFVDLFLSTDREMLFRKTHGWEKTHRTRDPREGGRKVSTIPADYRRKRERYIFLLKENKANGSPPPKRGSLLKRRGKGEGKLTVRQKGRHCSTYAFNSTFSPVRDRHCILHMQKEKKGNGGTENPISEEEYRYHRRGQEATIVLPPGETKHDQLHPDRVDKTNTSYRVREKKEGDVSLVSTPLIAQMARDLSLFREKQTGPGREKRGGRSPWYFPRPIEKNNFSISLKGPKPRESRAI